MSNHVFSLGNIVLTAQLPHLVWAGLSYAILNLDQWREDFSRSEQVSTNGETYTLTDSSKAVTYRFAPGQVLRTDAGLTDTFRLELSQVKAAFEGKVVEDEVGADQPPVDSTADGTRMDDLSFQVLYQKQTFPYHYHKQYSAQTLLNADPHAFY
ncbi:hypothetical protein [Mucilaginibacter sp.]